MSFDEARKAAVKEFEGIDSRRDLSQTAGAAIDAFLGHLRLSRARLFRQPEEMAYLALLKLPIGGTMRADPSIQSAMAALRDRIAYAQKREAEAVQDDYALLATTYRMELFKEDAAAMIAAYENGEG